MYTNFKVIGLTRLAIKLKSTAPEADALITRPSELLSVILCFVVINPTLVKTYLVNIIKRFLTGQKNV